VEAICQPASHLDAGIELTLVHALRRTVLQHNGRFRLLLRGERALQHREHPVFFILVMAHQNANVCVGVLGKALYRPGLARQAGLGGLSHFAEMGVTTLVIVSLPMFRRVGADGIHRPD
jgi:hypothetical protein